MATYLLLLCLCLLPLFVFAAPSKPGLMLARLYQQQEDLSGYWVSEKYDGVRAYWNGKALITRGGHKINAPQWFVAPFPQVPLDGELWIRQGAFDLVSGIVRRKSPKDSDWQQIKYMVFDLPDSTQIFEHRRRELEVLIRRVNQPWLQKVEDFKVANHQALKLKLQQVMGEGGEGLMLHKGNSLYQARRSHDLLKYKAYFDAEAVVVGYIPGKGKYAGLLGALLVETQDGRRFKIGSGLNDKLRKSPPATGTQITFRYSGLTKNGLPRFARFLRVRESL